MEQTNEKSLEEQQLQIINEFLALHTNLSLRENKTTTDLIKCMLNNDCPLTEKICECAEFKLNEIYKKEYYYLESYECCNFCLNLYKNKYIIACNKESKRFINYRIYCSKLNNI